MSLRTKIITTTAVPLMLLIAFGVLLFSDKHATLIEMRKTVKAAEVSNAISELVHESQKERGLSAGHYGSPNDSFIAKLRSQRSLVDQRREELESVLSETGLNADDVLAAFDRAVENRQKVTKRSIPLGQALGTITDAHHAGFKWTLSTAGNGSQSQLAYAQIGHTLIEEMKDFLGIQRAVLSNTFAAGSFQGENYEKLRILVAEVGLLKDHIQALSPPQVVDSLNEVFNSRDFEEMSRLVDLAISKHAEGGFNQDSAVWFQVATNVIDQIAEVKKQSSEYVLATALDSRNESQSAEFGIGAVVVASIGGMAVFSFWAITSTIRPLSRVKNMLNAVAAGDADLSTRISLGRKDELGQLADSVDAIFERLYTAAKQMESAGEHMMGTTTMLVESTTTSQELVSEQRNTINTISASAEELGQTAEIVSQRAADASTEAKSSQSIAEEGGRTIREAIEGIERLGESVRKSSAIVNSLGDRAESIGEIISVINDIADQTNLLALNAAIEAARAGEHGRGFAVVADEVRKLAERTVTATAEIESSITQIQDETKAVVQAMDAGRATAEEGSELAGKAQQNLGDIIQTFKGVLQLTESISVSAREQYEVSTSVSKQMVEMSQRGEEVADGATSAAESATQVMGAASQVSAVIAKLGSNASDRRVSRQDPPDGIDRRINMME